MQVAFEEFESKIKDEFPGAEVRDRGQFWQVEYKGICANYFYRSKAKTLYFPKVDEQKFGSRYQNATVNHVVLAIKEVNTNRGLVCKSKVFPSEQP